MGFFSWDCKGCGHSVRASCATNETSRWMSRAVFLFPHGEFHAGQYDGYGRIGHMDDFDDMPGEPEAWHSACYELAGKPRFTGESESAWDQGYFVGDFDPPAPKTVEEMNTMRAEGERKKEEQRAALRKAREEWAAEKAAQEAAEKAKAEQRIKAREDAEDATYERAKREEAAKTEARRNLKADLTTLGNRLVTERGVEPAAMAAWRTPDEQWKTTKPIKDFVDWLNWNPDAREILAEMGYDFPVVQTEG